MERVLIKHHRLEHEELEVEEALDIVQSCMMELLNETKGQFQQMRKQKALVKECGLKLTGLLSDELESEEPSGRSQEVPLADIALDWSNINFDKLGMFDFEDTVIKGVENAGGS